MNLKQFFDIKLFMLIYIAFWFLTPFPVPHSDEGNHLLLVNFYKNMIQFAFKNGISFSSLYQNGIDFLVHYPKITIHYPPLFHATLASVFLAIGSSVMAGRLFVLAVSLVVFFLVYKLGEKMFNKKVGLIASVLFMLSPEIFILSKTVMVEMALFLFFIGALLIFLKKKRLADYIILGIFIALGVLIKFHMLLIIPILFFYALWEKSSMKMLLLSFIIAAIITLPYLLVYYKLGFVGLMLKSSVQPERYSNLSINYIIDQFLYYPGIMLIQAFPVVAVLGFISFLYMIWKKIKYWNLLLIWFLIIYLFFSITPNKTERYTLLYLPIIIYSFSFVIANNFKKYVLPIFIITLIAQLSFIYIQVFFKSYVPYSELKYLSYSSQIEDATKYVYEKSKGNVAMVSESGSFYSGSFMFYLSNLDTNKTILVYRYCVFENVTSESIKKMLSEDNIYYVVLARNGTGVENFYKLEDFVTLEKSFEGVDIYRVIDFKTKTVKPCNYICLTGQTVCA